MGLLEKRIKDKFREITRIPIDALIIHEIRKIVEEMREEYPNLEYKMQRVKEGLFLNEEDEWFVKWLGAEPLLTVEKD